MIISTTAQIRSADLPKGKWTYEYATPQKGIRLKVTQNKKYWQAKVQIKGKGYSTKLGDADRPESQGGVTFLGAQKAYVKWLEDLAKGSDTRSIKKNVAVTQGNTFIKLAENFLADCERRKLGKSSLESYRRELLNRSEIKGFHKRAIKSIEGEEYYHLLTSLEKSCPGKNYPVKAALSSFYS